MNAITVYDLPTLQALTRELRDMNEAVDGPWTVALCFDADRWEHAAAPPPWKMPNHFGVESPDYPGAIGGREELPGDGRPFDAVAFARRILADCRTSIRERAAAAQKEPHAR